MLLYRNKTSSSGGWVNQASDFDDYGASHLANTASRPLNHISDLFSDSYMSMLTDRQSTNQSFVGGIKNLDVIFFNLISWEGV